MADVDAAVVASKLLDFYREPARHRPRYLSGQEAIAGQWVFKFAQSRFPHGILRTFNLDERRAICEAARAFIRQVCLRDAASHYDVLGVQATTRPETIKENYHLLMALLHPDRQDAQAGAWPATCAQRVNQAYAVLSDARARGQYDASLRKLGAGAASVAHAAQTESVVQAGATFVPTPRRRRRRAVRAAMLVTAVMAALLLIQMMWVSELPPEYRVLERAYPLDVSTRLVRSMFPTNETPRFLTENAWLPRASDAAQETSEVKRPRAREKADVVTVGEPVTSRGKGPAPAPVVRDEAPQPAREPARIATAPTALVQAPAAAAPVITAADIEALVARLVSSYEAGDIEGLMALVDRAEAASLRGERMRQAYDEFFRATRQRHLRVHTLGWQLDHGSARARGEVGVSAQYVGEASAVERRVPVEVDIALREGRPRITRLALFPDGT